MEIRFKARVGRSNEYYNELARLLEKDKTILTYDDPSHLINEMKMRGVILEEFTVEKSDFQKLIDLAQTMPIYDELTGDVYYRKPRKRVEHHYLKVIEKHNSKC